MKPTSYQSYKALYAAALERLCEEFPEGDLDDLKREAEKQVTTVKQTNEDKQADSR